MGQFICSRDYTSREEDWPYVWAIRHENILSTKQTDDGITLPTEIMPYLYLSDLKHVRDVKLLKSMGITHVINMASSYCSSGMKRCKKYGIKVLKIDAEDEIGYKILSSHFSEVYNFIESAKNINGKCVVHCVAGVNRSGVIVAAYKMIKERLSVLDVVLHCRLKRGNKFLRNETFQEELVAMARYENLLGFIPGHNKCCVKISIPKNDNNLLNQRSRIGQHQTYYIKPERNFNDGYPDYESDSRSEDETENK